MSRSSDAEITEKIEEQGSLLLLISFQQKKKRENSVCSKVILRLCVCSVLDVGTLFGGNSGLSVPLEVESADVD